jgi:glycosyltransferase involved in cell wall biosynthesis
VTLGLEGRSLVFVNNFPAPFLGGGELYVLHLARGAKARGMDVTVVAMPSSAMAAEARAAGADVVELDVMAGGLLGAASAVARVLLSVSADIVHGTGYWTNLLARLAGRRAGAAVVNSVLCEPASTLKAGGGVKDRIAQSARELADNLTAGRAAVIIANSGAVERGLVRQGIPASRIRVVHHGIDAEDVRAQARLGPVPAALVDGQRPSVKVGTIGRLEAVKGIDYLLDSAVLLADRDDVRFFIAGAGSQADRLAARVAGDARLSRSVSLVGFLDSAPAFLAGLDICCLSSLSEGLPTTLLEALALEIPVISTAVGGTPEVVEDGVTGLLVPPADPAALAAAIRRFASDPEEARRTALAGRARVDREFTVARMVDDTLEIYAELPASIL